MPKQKPRLLVSPLTNTVWCVTRYREIGGGIIEALEKYDVTEDFLAILPQPQRAGTEEPV